MKKIDHILVRVANLEKAIAHFKHMGFRVYKGNTKNNCHHAMIYFKDGSFLELIDQSKFPSIFKLLAKIGILKNLGIVFRKFSHYTLSNERFLDYAIFTENIVTFYKDSKFKSVSKLIKMKRKNHLGRSITWKLFAFKDMHLPFVMSEYSPFRLPEENATSHDNKVMGIQEIKVETDITPEIYADNFNIHFGTNANNNTIKIGNANIQLEASNRYRIKSITLFTKSIITKSLTDLESYNISLVNY